MCLFVCDSRSNAVSYPFSFSFVYVVAAAADAHYRFAWLSMDAGWSRLELRLAVMARHDQVLDHSWSPLARRSRKS